MCPIRDSNPDQLALITIVPPIKLPGRHTRQPFGNDRPDNSIGKSLAIKATGFGFESRPRHICTQLGKINRYK